MEQQATDWTAYYNKPRSFFSTFTQRYTLDKLVYYFEKYCPKENKEIIELGGGNSCFAKDLYDRLSIKRYAIVDNNSLAVEKAKSQEIPMDCFCLNALEGDLSGETGKYDVVYSVGLIEHFRGDDIRKMIGSHFELVKDDGMVLISFPTPTRKYRFIRGWMERLHVWQFYDEFPLTWEDVRSWFEAEGVILAREINRKLPLTQMIVVAKKR